MPIAVSVAEAKKQFSELLNRVVYGHEEVIVTKRGKPVAILSARPKSGLGPIKGWLDEKEPFFRTIDKIIEERHRHTLRITRRRKG